ncbi:ABC transporter substrate-binding protein [Cohnella suwonensis]|uniref:ABC transporter substrate-binding protein n=1 Tax=Cohnella suwonensis TaxID=696072 RepID=A0ABW0LX91_9BACL
MNKRRLIVVILLLVLAGCTNENNDRGAAVNGDIVIGVGWPLASRNEGLAEGVGLAVEEINAGDGVLGRKLRIVSADDGGSVTEGLSVAARFAADPATVAVIGHRGSSVSLAAAAVYDKEGIVMLTPGSTSPKLTQSDYRYVFRMIPSDDRISARLAHYAASQGYKKVAILYTDDEYGRGLANAFEDSGKEQGIDTVDRLAEYTDLADLTRLVREWTALGCDAVFVAEVMPGAARTVSDLMLAGSNLPILGGDGLDSAELAKTAGTAAEGAIVASIFNPLDKRAEVSGFIEKYKGKYGEVPGKWAGQGYDAVMLLADAIRSAGTTRPTDIANVLHGTSGWIGVTGSHSFDESGDVTDKPIVLKEVVDGAFRYLRD